MVFLARVAFSTATLAELWLKRASAASRSAGVAAFWPRSVLVRLRLLLASAASASADASCASSVEVSSRTITSPRRTNAPESKPSSRTVPGTSEATVTARTATSVPTASRDACHFTASTLAEVTVSGGMANDLPAITDEIRQCVVDGQPPRVVRDLAVQQGLHTLQTEAIRLVQANVTTMEEVVKHVLVNEGIE